MTFDEYHHGYSYGRGMMSLLGTPARLGLAQIAIAFILLVFALSRRFGRPIPLAESTRQRSEYLSSMSALLRKARATGLAKSELGHMFLRETAVTLGLPPSADPDAILEAANRRCPDKAPALRQLVIEAAEPPHDGMDEAHVLSLAARWHRMRKELK